MKHSVRIGLLYAVFCGLAIGVNLGVQWLVSAWSSLGFLSALVAGTTYGLLLKYVLDRNYIFTEGGPPLTRDFIRFVLYAGFGLVTTAVFWSAEFFGEAVWPGPGRYVGGGLGLALGYLIKYLMDRRWVFAPRPPGKNPVSS